MRKIVMGSLFLMLGLAGQAQDFIFGLQHGFGSYSYKEVGESTQFVKENAHKSMLTLGFSPYLSKFTFVSGLEFEFRKESNHLTIPLGARLTFGEKYRFYGEGSYYYSLFLNDKDSDLLHHNDHGVRLGLGMEMALDKRWRLEGGFQQYFGLANTVEQVNSLPANVKSYDSGSLKAFYFHLGVKYRY